MKEFKSQFVNSWHELKNRKTLVTTAMLVAIAVVLGFYTIQVSETLKIGFSFIPNELASMLFGPVVGGIMAGVADILKFIIKPSGPFFFGFTLNAILGGILYGVILYRKPLSLIRIIWAKLVVTVVINLFLTTYWLSMLYGEAFVVLLSTRVLKQVIMFPIEVIIFYTLVKALSKTKVISEIRQYRNQ